MSIIFWYFVIGVAIFVVSIIVTISESNDYKERIESEGILGIVCISIAIFIASWIWPILLYKTFVQRMKTKL